MMIRLPRQGHAALILIDPARFFLRVGASGARAAKKDHLGNPLPHVQSNRQRRKIGELDR